MAGLEGTVKTPLGQVSKKTALIAVGGLVLIGGIVWYRAKQTRNQQDSLAAASTAEINPATGYPYGSAEDAAALAAQSSFISPGGGGVGGGAGGYPPGGIGFVNNSQWVQAVIEYMTTTGLVEDPAQLSAALGVYIVGSPATVAQKSLIEQAIAAQGYPPLAGPSGYPPAINTAPVAPPTPPLATPPPATPPPATTPAPTVPVGHRISVPLGYNLYEWTKQVAAGYHVPYSFEIMEQLNPGVRQYIVWLGNVSPKTPVFRPSGGVPPVRIR